MASDKYKTVLISGAGELGSRYLQSMVSCTLPLVVHLHSNNLRSLEVCQQRWLEVKGDASPHRLVMHLDLSALPEQIDLAIVSSTADSRPLLVASIAQRIQVSYWLLEKVLAQSVADIDQILAYVCHAAGSWVNYYMRAEAWYAEIKKHLVADAPKHMRVYGGDWGMACNSLHFIHLHAWFSESTLTSLDTGRLSDAWHASKRAGNWEISGELTAEFADGGRVELQAGPGPAEYSLTLQDGPYTWQIMESSGIARRSDGLEVVGRVLYQSQRRLVEEILGGAGCGLPALAAVADADRMFVGAMLEHWRQHKDPAAMLVPIT